MKRLNVFPSKSCALPPLPVKKYFPSARRAYLIRFEQREYDAPRGPIEVTAMRIYYSPSLYFDRNLAEETVEMLRKNVPRPNEYYRAGYENVQVFEIELPE